ncbi:MAG: transcription antitermination factor NusB [Steroidobacteraceae bacterium]
MSSTGNTSSRRAMARKLAMQALYRWQINPAPWQDLLTEFSEEEDMPKADLEYFTLLVRECTEHSAKLDEAMTELLDRAPATLDPIEHALLWIGTFELQHCPDVPFRVVINEAVRLAKRYGATDGHKYLNGVLDRAARQWRVHER